MMFDAVSEYVYEMKVEGGTTIPGFVEEIERRLV
jgi:hypothetical protein